MNMSTNSRPAQFGAPARVSGAIRHIHSAGPGGRAVGLSSRGRVV